MARYTLDDFVARTAEQQRGQGLFELENDRLMEVNLDGLVWTKTGSMVAYLGQIKFSREGAFEHGIGKFLKHFLHGVFAIRRGDHLVITLQKTLHENSHVRIVVGEQNFECV